MFEEKNNGESEQFTGSKTDETLISDIMSAYPTARKGLVEGLVKCIRIHAKKNADYNGDMELYRAIGIKGRFCDIWRKVIRLYNGIMWNADFKVDESLEDTAQDLVVYSAMLVEELEQNKKGESQVPF